MQDRDYDYRRGHDQGRRGWDRGREGGPEWGRWGGSDPGREREESMLQRRGYSGGEQQVWRAESGSRGGGYKRRDFGGEYGPGGFERSNDYRRRHDYGDSDHRREEDDRSEFQPGEGEIMYRPGLMRTSNHSDTEYEPRARGPMTERRGYWGQGGAGGQEFGGYGGGQQTGWEGGSGRQGQNRDWDYGGGRTVGRSQEYDREQFSPGRGGSTGYGRGGTLGREEDGGWDRSAPQGQRFYREGGMTREGRQITSRQSGPFAGRGPRGYQRGDDRIREDVCEVLYHHGEIDASEVEVRVENGEVTLTGTVEDRWQKRMIEDAIEDVSGVKDVNNQLRVQQRTGQQSGTGQNNLARTGQTTTGATTASATGATADPGGEAERAGTNARNATRAR